MTTNEYIFDNTRRVVILIEDQDGNRRFCEFNNLIAPVRISQYFEEYRGWDQHIVRQVQTEPIEMSIPNHGGWTFYDTTADIRRDPPALETRTGEITP